MADNTDDFPLATKPTIIVNVPKVKKLLLVHKRTGKWTKKKHISSRTPDNTNDFLN